ncbi:uncharacterized protein LOC110983904 isoform X2 [Acanthaster planci]|uniref:Uncharacterized protein LOC110983904 isoform X2 n=2 Tax=Acanthaster planci TaxID=133434 RepID=A0A8B7Z7H4_ACAPL|nr:uncharacterized protein LOC110983904 isoform X2 [Acanthaster planci]
MSKRPLMVQDPYREVELAMPVQVQDNEDVHPPIRPGVSLINTSVSQMIRNANRIRVCAVTVVNHTRWRLESAGVFVGGGNVLLPQQPVEPQTAEAFVAQKTASTATGTYGTASYLVQGSPDHPLFINVMWSIAFDRNIFKNRLGVEVGHQYNRDDFQRLYSPLGRRADSETRVFSTRDGLVPIRIEKNHLLVTGNLGNDSKTEAIIHVYENWA